MKVHPFMDKPIPDLSRFRFAKTSYRDYKIVPVDEACIKVNNGILCQSYYWHYDPRPEGAIEDVFLRQTLVLKLIKIDAILRQLGLCLLVQEGYRPISVQKFVQTVSVLKGLRKENPNLSEIQLSEKLKLFAASVNLDSEKFPTPHLTGGSVDLSLVCLETRKQVNMGKSLGLFSTAFPEVLEDLSNFHYKLDADLEMAKRFRRLLYWLVLEQQMIVNPTEWWHVSFGDQMWALMTGATHAIYGAATRFI
jgi:D-alanyl-D-alanine dipeptidase